MESDDPALQPVIVLRVVIRSPDLDTFVSKYSRFIKDDRIFIFTKSSQPPGTRVRFTLELADGMPLIHGEGTVTRIRSDVGDASKPPGMELKFVPLDEASRKLVGRMLDAREHTGQFKEETTDVQTKVRDANTPSPALREFTERPPTLPPLEKTGAHAIISREEPSIPGMGQDESGAVTIAQAPPGERTAPDTPPPSIGLASLTSLPPPIPDNAYAAADRQSGGFSTPTPLPAPIPASDDYAASQREMGGAAPANRNERPANQATAPAEMMLGADSGQFAAVGPAPAFAEAFRAMLPGGPPPTPPTGTVPANPFSEISDGAIEYFVEWSMEQSTAPKPKVASAHFANVAMATPRAERRRSARGPLLAGMAVGVFLGVPIGGAIVWYGLPPPAPVIVEKMPEASPPPTLALGDLAVTAAKAPAADLAVAPAHVTASRPPIADLATHPTEIAAKPVEPAAKPVEPAAKPVEAATKPAKAKKAELVISSRPPGATVTVDGEAQGKTPVTLTVSAGAHEVSVAKERYATVTQSIEAPGKLDVPLKRPSATLHVDSEPPGGEVIVEGKPRGKTPVDVTLDAFHHYDVQVMLLGTKPWHKRVNLKPPQTDVSAKLSVIRDQ
jgi:hypothetical protein